MVIAARYLSRPKPQSTDATGRRNTGNRPASFNGVVGPVGENELLIEHSGGRRVNRAPCVHSSGGFTVHATSLRTCGCKECKSLLKYTHKLGMITMKLLMERLLLCTPPALNGLRGGAFGPNCINPALKFLLFRLKKPPEEEEEVSPDGSWTCAVRGEGATFTGFSLFPALRLCWG
ncbi:uncharacterized protein LOC144944421 [Lampetra fluviatilis]